jgi:benzoyl-CoA reductase subunit D
MSLITAGVDVGTSAVKVALMAEGPGGGTLLSTHRERIHRRDPGVVAEVAFHEALQLAGKKAADIAYVASTGEGESLPFRTGHFYGMTTHARGATYLAPDAKAVVDVGALHARVMIIDERARVLKSRMTSQCASGTGQFVENIARYLGVRLDEVGSLSLQAPRSEVCSGICAVLAETDVINMISRGIPVGEVLRGIHESIAVRLVKLLRSVGAESPVVLTGGLAADDGLIDAMKRAAETDGGKPLGLVANAKSVFAGAIGAAIWAAYRHHKLQQRASA